MIHPSGSLKLVSLLNLQDVPEGHEISRLGVLAICLCSGLTTHPREYLDWNQVWDEMIA